MAYCNPVDPNYWNCVVTQTLTAFWDIVGRYVLAIVLVIFAILVLPRAGWKGVVLSALIIFFVLWWYGLLTVIGLPAICGYFNAC